MNNYWNRWKADTTRPLALFYSIAFALLFSWRFFLNHALIFLLLSFRFWVMSYYVANRFPPEGPISFYQRGIAYASMSVPFFYHDPLHSVTGPIFFFGETLALIGTLLATWGLIDLGRRFGIAPAKRGEVCRSGVYRWLKHPIYVGYALMESDCVILNPANLGIYAVSMASLFVRSRLENRVLEGGIA
jgi:hypothetical protein